MINILIRVFIHNRKFVILLLCFYLKFALCLIAEELIAFPLTVANSRIMADFVLHGSLSPTSLWNSDKVRTCHCRVSDHIILPSVFSSGKQSATNLYVFI
jgi:hypothetical protein